MLGLKVSTLGKHILFQQKNNLVTFEFYNHSKKCVFKKTNVKKFTVQVTFTTLEPPAETYPWHCPLLWQWKYYIFNPYNLLKTCVKIYPRFPELLEVY